MGAIKCNVDVATFNDNSIMRYDVCFRDSSELFMFDKSNYFYSFTTCSRSSNHILVGSYSRWKLSKWPYQMKCMLFCLKLIANDDLATTNVPLNEFGVLISQCRSLLLNKPDFVVSHIIRQTNRVS